MTALRIVSLIGSGKATGAAVPALEQAERLHHAGHAVLFACRAGTLADDADARGVPRLHTLRLPSTPLPWRLGRDIGALRDLIETWKPDLILTHRTPEMFAAAWAARGRVPVLRVWHDGRGEHNPLPVRAAVRLLGARVACTSGTAAAIFEPVMRHAAVPVFRPAVDGIRFSPEHLARRLRTDLRVGTDQVLLGTVARWKHGRNLEECIAAMAAACAVEPRLRCAIIGRGELRGALEALIARAGMTERLHLVTTEAYPEALASLDIGTLLAPGSDGGARAALEMGAMRLPMVLMRRGSLADFATYDGFTCVDHPGELHDAWLALARDASWRARAGAAARKSVLSRHAPDTVLEAEVRALRDVVADFRRPQPESEDETP